jgi:hypothetical protein
LTFLDVRFSQNDVRFTPESGHWRRYFLGVIGVERATWSLRLSNNAKS